MKEKILIGLFGGATFLLVTLATLVGLVLVFGPIAYAVFHQSGIGTIVGFFWIIFCWGFLVGTTNHD